jgi:hypothetical protein
MWIGCEPSNSGWSGRETYLVRQALEVVCVLGAD